ncbi:type II toxin-antitoxin system HicA family toxin [Xenorhabdus hominickii]|uniref:Hexulose-6-phosphate synthase n=1 Tax=Xenorhabdus hominickii TaxID=351679 RepID=A0A1V0M4J4_XENHO|nr:type II toxin-antitoxin system HicA family toxin [Xenorhabdus hominickii]ARD69791.1 hypothetical protein [Xenorhabdus hominickii]PHM51575.1 hexulose-6-phosphate synthase [Xenorhabdus hominickii]
MSTIFDIQSNYLIHDLKWDDVVSLIKKLDGKIKNGNGSRRKFVLMGSVYQTHQPHPSNVMDKGAVNGLREWFENVIGVDYD